jgi:hypothetical protein
VQPTVPKIEPTAARATSAPAAATRSERKHVRHAADTDPASAASHEAAPNASDDPLAGTNL